MVNICIQDGDGKWIRALDIPPEDIARLSLRPLKWLRFVAFAALGAKGDLFDGPVPGSNLVNYETSHVGLAESYYYFVPDASYRLADNNGLNSHMTSSANLQRFRSFREKVARRDGSCCVITRGEEAECHAAHIIPHAKGDEYIQFVLSDRCSLYEDYHSRDLKNIGIDSTENGLFLTTDLHSRFNQQDSVFLMTPNFALSPADIPRVECGVTPASRTTIQHLVPYPETDRRPTPQWDVLADWSGEDAPPTLLFDYAYGMAAIQHWATPDIQDMLKSRHETVYRPKISSKSNTDVEPTEPMDSESCRALDFAFQFSMLFRGYPPGTTWQMLRRRQVEEAEMRSRQGAQEKVLGWLETSESLPSVPRGLDDGVAPGTGHDNG